MTEGEGQPVRDILQLGLKDGKSTSLGLEEVLVDTGDKTTAPLGNADASFASMRHFIRNRKMA